MTDLNELYQEMILEHNRSPRNFQVMPDATKKAEGYNPLCGDRLMLYLKLDNGRIADISFHGSGCAISKASASMMTTMVKGKTKTEAEALIEDFRKMLSREAGSDYDAKRLGKLAVFSGVCEFPARVKCATLAWHTLYSGLENEAKIVSTEEGGQNHA